MAIRRFTNLLLDMSTTGMGINRNQNSEGEWCQDWYSDNLPGGMVLDPQGPATGSDRVVRGSRWRDRYGGAGNCRSARRIYILPVSGGVYFGLRVVLAPGQP